MITFVLFLVFSGFYFCYHTSRRMDLKPVLAVEKWACENKRFSKMVGLGLLTASAIFSALIWGIGAGILMFFIVLMTIASLIVVLTPIRILNYKWVSLIFVFSLTLEVVLA